MITTPLVALYVVFMVDGKGGSECWLMEVGSLGATNGLFNGQKESVRIAGIALDGALVLLKMRPLSESVPDLSESLSFA